MAHKSLCHAAAVWLCAVIMTYILTAQREKMLAINISKCSQPSAAALKNR